MPGLAFYDLFSHKLSNIVIVKKICNALSGCSAYLNISQSFQKRFWIQIYSFNAPMVSCHITIRLNQYGDTASLIPDHIIVFEGKKREQIISFYLSPYRYLYYLCDILFNFLCSLWCRTVLPFAKASSWYSLCIHWQANESEAQVIFVYLFAYLIC